MKKTMVMILIAMAMVLVTCCNSFAVNSLTIPINATVSAMSNGIERTITSITPGVPAAGSCTGTDTWGATTTSISFGNLNWDATNKIFYPSVYYAVDVGVLDNVATRWQITHTRTNFANAAGTADLNNNLNVVFVKQRKNPDGTETETLLEKLSYASSDGKSVSKEDVSGGWLRIYYGFATGRTVGATNCDATGTTPVTIDNAAGTYDGRVILTYLVL